MTNCSNCACRPFARLCKNSNLIPNIRNWPLKNDWHCSWITNAHNAGRTGFAVIFVRLLFQCPLPSKLSTSRPHAVWNVVSFLSWDSAIGSPLARTWSFLDQPVRENLFWRVRLEWLRRALVSACAITELRVYFIPSLRRGKMAHGLSGCDQWLAPVC